MYDILKSTNLFYESKRLTQKYHGNEVGLIAPLYFSNICVNNCRGCDFKLTNKSLMRRTLNEIQLKEEIEYIQKMGYGTIELVSGSFHWKSNMKEKFLKFLEAGRNLQNLAFNIDSLTEHEYKEFANDNLTMILWQESYNKKSYRRMVGQNSPTKSDFYKRIKSQENWIKAGGKKYGLGILAGVSNEFFKDIENSIEHGLFLKKEFGLEPSVIGIPRYQISNTNYKLTKNLRQRVSDEDLLKAVALYRIFFPKANIVASTREPQEMIEKILEVGGTFTNFFCSTDVGGYENLLELHILGKEKIKKNNEQFFHPDPTFKKMKKTIEKAGKIIKHDKEF